MPEHPDVALIHQAVVGSKAEKLLMRRLALVLRAPIRAHLRKWPGRKLAGLDEGDLTHEIFLKLLERDRAALRKWEPSRSSLEQFVSLFARSRIIELERKELRRLEIMPHPVGLDTVAEPRSDASLDELVMVKQTAQKLRECIENAVRPAKGKAMIELLFDLHLSTDEAVQRSGMTRSQVAQWKSQIFKHARKCLNKLMENS